MRFPARAGDSFTIDTGVHGHVRMTILRTDDERTTLAGVFEGCVTHEARFETRGSGGAGLVVETTWCEGIGEVTKRIHLADMPLPVTFELVSTQDDGTTLASAR